jgi:hypothetical protein
MLTFELRDHGHEAKTECVEGKLKKTTKKNLKKIEAWN